ncbi:MAG TPA: IS66 family transposase [Planctomycetaceae bacterium]|nr:IS66 family transposase [Planctomycetaceae bacterium]
MERTPEIPADPAACRQQLAEAYRELDAQRLALAEQQRVLEETAACYEELRQEREALRHELEMFRRWVYGRRRERIMDADGQRHLFELPEADQTRSPQQEQTETPPPGRRPRRRSRTLDLDRLPRHRIEHDVPEDEKQCGSCGRRKTKIGSDETKVLHYRPAVLEVEVHVLPKYACPCCKQGVASPPPPPRVLPRSIAGPGLISQILVSKFGDHLPLYRQEDIFVRHGIHLPRSTLCDWVKSAADLLGPLSRLQKRRVLSSERIWTDDTPVRMLDPQAEGGSRQARFWTYIGDDEQPYSVYDFTPSRKRDGPANFLKGFRGCLHADAYGGYDGLALESGGAFVRVACGAHLRRKFVDARTSAPRECAQMLEWFRQLYDVEDRGREFSPQERLRLRRAEAGPVLTRMQAYLEDLSRRALPKSALGQAVTYARNQWEAFCRYAEDGRRTIDNNVSERTLRAQAVGRKNWLFLGHENAGPRAAVLFTVLAGAKRHRIEPWAYLTDVLLHLTADTEDLDPLLPDRWARAHPEHVLTHRLEESRRKRARQQATRAERRRTRR